MTTSRHRTPVHGQTDSPRRTRTPYGKRKAAGGRRVLEMTISMAGLEGLRTRVAAWINRLGAAQVSDDAVLVAHELATNVIRHGGGIGRLRMWRERGRIVFRVSDSGPGMPSTVREPESRRPGGRGLWIARKLADLRIDSGPSGTVVVAAMPL